MKNFSTPLIERTKEYAAGFIGEHFTEKICYHNIDHTLEVVEAVQLIGRKCGISDPELEMVVIAAWFHDTGYYLGCENHEDASAKIAASYLKSQKIDPSFIKTVSNCILSTKIPQQPHSLLEKIICDADLYHLGTEKFFEKSELLWQENKFHNVDMSPEYWLNMSKEFVEAHEYHTPYGKQVLLPRLLKNLELLKSKLKAIEL